MDLANQFSKAKNCVTFLLLLALCQADEDWKNFDHYSTGGDAITSLDLDHLTGHVYLCNETTICHLNQHLQEQECASTDVPCLFLKVEQHHRYLFVGGTTSHVRSLRNVESVVQVLDNPLSVFSECNGTHGLPCYTLILGSDKDDKSVFFIGSSRGVDVNVKTPKNETPSFISSRKLVWDEDEQAQLKMGFAASDFKAVASVSSQSRYRNVPIGNENFSRTTYGYSALYISGASPKIIQVYSFKHQGFVYFVTNQRLGTGAYKVYLSRVCQNDPLFSSYIIGELQYSPYNFAQMAYFVEESPPRLYVVLKKYDTRKGKLTMNDQQVRAFYMSDVGEAFTKTEKICLQSTYRYSSPDLLNWLYVPYRKFSYCKMAQSDSACEHPNNFGIEVGNRLPSGKVHQITDFEATSLFVSSSPDNPGTFDILYLGTSGGYLAIVEVDRNTSNSQKLLTSVAMVEAETMAAWKMVPNSARTDFFLSAGGQVVRVPVASCDVYMDCIACVAKNSSTNCAWCDGKCRSAAQCERLPRQGKVCVPLIKSVSPTSGPRGGGTRLTIRGAYFGIKLPLHRRSLLDFASVKVGPIPCSILERTANRIICKTKPGGVGLVHDVVVDVRDRSQWTLPAEISGRAVLASSFGFQYKDVALSSEVNNSLSPQLGPLAGGTSLTIYGSNLDASNNASVMIGERECSIIRRQSDAIICTTPPWKVNYSQHFLPERSRLVQLPVHVQIDTLDLQVIDPFVYVANPVVEEFQPTASFASGGIPISVKGRYLNAVQHPMMHIQVVGSMQKVTVACEVSEDGNSMVCQSPMIDVASEANTLQFSGRKLSSLGLLANVWFELDGVDSVRYRPFISDKSTLSFFLDPSFTNVGVYSVYTNETKLTLHGQNLQSLQRKDTIKITLGKGQCEVNEIRSNYITCIPHYDLDTFNSGSDVLDVKIEVGNLLFEPGHVWLREHGKECSCD